MPEPEVSPVPYSLPGVGTRLVINGNEFRIVYTRHEPNFRLTAEFIGKHEPKDKDSSADNRID